MDTTQLSWLLAQLYVFEFVFVFIFVFVIGFVFVTSLGHGKDGPDSNG